MKKNHAFSLVELSIVLVILGLLAGGIMAGQSLIRASELRNASTEYSRFTTAIQTFREKYSALPGDFSSATRYWNRQLASGYCVTNSGASVGSPGACDGNGDTIPDGYSGTGTQSEPYQVWRHLSASGLIDGSFTGADGLTTSGCDTTNCPVSKVPGGTWSSFSFYPFGTTTEIKPMLELGKNSGGRNSGGIFKPEEAWNIDTKLDDGNPSQGAVRPVVGSTCINGVAASATYKLDTTDIVCALQFNNAYR